MRRVRSLFTMYYLDTEIVYWGNYGISEVLCVSVVGGVDVVCGVEWLR